MRARMASVCSAGIVMLSTVFVSCDQRADIQGPEGSVSQVVAGGAVQISDAMKQLRNATARFNSQEQALKAGYVPTDHCVANPMLGGMGYHWANPTLIDPVFDIAKPEVVLYAPGENGRQKLVAVEYVVIDVGQPRPSFDGHPFDIGGAPIPAPHWTLHVWLYENNEAGVFTPFNHAVACSH